MKTKWWNYNDNISKFYPPKQHHFQGNFAQNMKACRKIYNLSYSFPREDDDYGNVFSKFLHSQIPLWYICLNHFRCQGFQYYFLAHLSWKLKWAFLITFRPLSVRPLSIRLSVRPSVCKLFTFSSSSPEPLGQFQPNLAQSILGWRGFKFVQMKGPVLFQG